MTVPSSPPPLESVLEAATDAARRAGAILRDGYLAAKAPRVDYKGVIDLVTEYDVASERIILDRIRQSFPDHQIVAEESGTTESASPFRWYIDPLDGTTNFAHKFPVFCVSVAFEASEGGLQAGVVYDPLRDELFAAAKGQGAFLNGTPLSVSGQSDLNRALVMTGFPYDLRSDPLPILERFGRMILAAQGVRRAGSAALDLAWVAAGRLDGFWEERLHPWDTAAGVLLVREAGGRVTDFSGQPFPLQAKEILATNGHLHYTMLQVLNPSVEVPTSKVASSREERE